MTTEALRQAADAIRGGVVETLRALLEAKPGLATDRLREHDGGRTLLHVATDWPGHRPRVAETIAVLADAGADVDAPFEGSHAETPLHWAASCDDVIAIDALVQAGAAIDAPGGSVGDGTGTPLFDATVFGQWSAARRLLEHGAATGGWEEASLGLRDRLAARLAAGPPSRRDLEAWLWAACHGGQQEAAALLLEAGADRDRASDWDGLTPLDAARRAEGSGTPGADAVVAWLVALGARSSGR